MLSDFGPAPPVTWPSKIGRKGLHFDEVGISWHSMPVLNKAELAYLSNSCLYFSSSDILFFFPHPNSSTPPCFRSFTKLALPTDGYSRQEKGNETNVAWKEGIQSLHRVRRFTLMISVCYFIIPPEVPLLDLDE